MNNDLEGLRQKTKKQNNFPTYEVWINSNPNENYPNKDLSQYFYNEAKAKFYERKYKEVLGVVREKLQADLKEIKNRVLYYDNEQKKFLNIIDRERARTISKEGMLMIDRYNSLLSFVGFVWGRQETRGKKDMNEEVNVDFIRIKFSHQYSKLSKDRFTTIRWNSTKNNLKYYTAMMNAIPVRITYKGNQNYYIVDISVKKISKLTNKFLKDDSDLSREGFMKLMSKWYSKKPDWKGEDSEVIILTLQKEILL